MEKNKNIIILLSLLGLCLYAGSLFSGFVWDDNYLIVNNSYIKNISKIPALFSADLFKAAGQSTNFYRPVQALSFMLDYAIWRLLPLGYHLTNILLHITNTILVYMLAFFFLKDKKMSIFTAVLFLAHPVQVEAVSYIAGRADLLGMMFLLLSLFCYARGSSYLALSVVFFALSVISKEAAIVFPFILLFYEGTFKNERKRSDAIKSVAPFFAVFFIYLFLRATALKFGQIPALEGGLDGLVFRVLTALKAFFEYFKVLFYPAGLHMERIGILQKPVFYPALFFYFLFFTTFILAWLYLKKASKAVFFLASWFFIALLPSLGVFVPLNADMAEHWLYIPSFGFFGAVSMIFMYIYRKQAKPTRQALSCLAVFIIFLLCLLTIKQQGYWKDDLTFFKTTVQKSLFSSKAHSGLGLAYLSRDPEKARIELAKAAVLDAGNKLYFYNNIGFDYSARKEYGLAEEYYKKAIKLQPDYAQAYNNLASVYISEGRLEEAGGLIDKAISINPDFPQPYFNLALLHRARKERDKEITSFKKGLKVDPDFIPALYELSLLCAEDKDYKGAEKLLKTILWRQPSNLDARFDLGTIYIKQNYYNKAKKQYQALLRYCPLDTKGRINLAVALFETGEARRAIEEYKKVLELKPDSEKAAFNLGLIYKKTARFKEAVSCFEKVLSINPSNERARQQIAAIERLSE